MASPKDKPTLIDFAPRAKTLHLARVEYQHGSLRTSVHREMQGKKKDRVRNSPMQNLKIHS